MTAFVYDSKRPMVPRPDPNIRPDAPILAKVGTIAVPTGIQEHRFVREALAIANLKHKKEDDLEKVIGTVNSKTCELYGWGANVDSHVDNSGFMYLVPLVAGFSMLYTWHGDDVGEQRLAVGEVVRLWDFALHWTEDDGPVVAAFVGSWAVPSDAEAVAILAAGVEALVRGDYYGAPRVRDGFRVMLPDECRATSDFENSTMMLTADAVAQGLKVIPCSQCDSPAHDLDNHWPYFWDGNVCAKHRARRNAESGVAP